MERIQICMAFIQVLYAAAKAARPYIFAERIQNCMGIQNPYAPNSLIQICRSTPYTCMDVYDHHTEVYALLIQSSPRDVSCVYRQNEVPIRSTKCHDARSFKKKSELRSRTLDSWRG